jgi:hypothetical protein
LTDQTPEEASSMEFIQVVEFQTSNIDEVIAVARGGYPDSAVKPSSVTVMKDRDRPNTYATLLRFDSYEDAMAHSESDLTHERVARLAPLMSGERRFYNLDVIDEYQP